MKPDGKVKRESCYRRRWSIEGDARSGTCRILHHAGASTLDHELRLYVRELRDRSHTVDELNRAIDRLCRENDINIAFNQLEVHLHNAKGDEVALK